MEKIILKKDERTEVAKDVNKLAVGILDYFLPSYINEFDIEYNNIIKSFRDYYRVKVALVEIKEFIEIFAVDSIDDLDASILTTNLSAFINLVEARIKKIEVKLKEDGLTK